MYHFLKSILVKATILFIYFCAFITPRAEAKECYGASFTRFHNTKLTCGVFKTISAKPLDCREACGETLSCFSVNMYKSANGSDVCELGRGTKSLYGGLQSPCFVWKENCEYSEISKVDTCQSPSNCPYSFREVLPDGWYRLGSSAYKLFKTKKIYADANAACVANGGALATIGSEAERQFINGVHLPQLKEKKLEDVGLFPLQYWKLDGNDTNIKLYGSATYDQLYGALNLPGVHLAYATSPAFPIHNMSFTVAVWMKVETCVSQHYYFFSYWYSPVIFAFIASGSPTCTLSFTARSRDGSRDMIILAGGNVVDKKWTHAAVTWDRATKTIIIYQDGVAVKTATITDADVDLPTATRSEFDIGLKRDNSVMTKAKLKDLTVFSRALTGQEIVLIRDTTGIKRAWIGPPASSLSYWFPVLTDSSSQCIVAAGPQMKWDKRVCNEKNEFICKKNA